MRVGVVFGHTAVRRPAGVADAKLASQIDFSRSVFHFSHAANPAHAGDVCAGMHGDAGGIITTIFKTLQTFDQNRNHITLRNRADDTAHRFPPLSYGAELYAKGKTKATQGLAAVPFVGITPFFTGCATRLKRGPRRQNHD